MVTKFTKSLYMGTYMNLFDLKKAQNIFMEQDRPIFIRPVKLASMVFAAQTYLSFIVFGYVTL